MSDTEPRPAGGDDWWSSGANTPGGAHRLGSVSGQPPRQSNFGHDQVGYQPYPPAGYTQSYPPGYPPYPPPPYAGYGNAYPGTPQVLPPYGPGSLADPGSRLGARLLDGIFMIPVIVVSVILATAIVRPWETVINSFGTTGSSLSAGRLVAWFILTFAFMLIGWTLYESLFTHGIGRTLARRFCTSARNGTAISDPT